MKRFARGDSAVLPPRVLHHIVAARYGTTPELVRAWPADDFIDACSFLAVTAGPPDGR